MSQVSQSPQGFFHTPNLDHYKQQAELAASNKGGEQESDFYNITKGKHYVRILPPWTNVGPSASMIEKVVWKHSGLPNPQPSGPEDSTRSSMCLKTWPHIYGVNCPICQVLDGLGATHTKIKDEMGAYQSWYVNALVYKFDPNRGSLVLMRTRPYIIRLTRSIINWIWSQISNPLIGDITNPYTGRIIEIDRTEIQGKYYQMTTVSQGPISKSEEEIAAISQSIHNLDEIFREPDQEYLNMINTMALMIKNSAQDSATAAATSAMFGLSQAFSSPQTASIQAPVQNAGASTDVPISTMQQTPPAVSPTSDTPTQTQSTPVVETTVQAPVQPETPQAPTAPSAQTEASTTALPNGMTPSPVPAPVGSPECFSNYSIVSATDEGKQKCNLCPVEYGCRSVESQKAAK